MITNTGQKLQLGQLLIEQGVLTSEQLEKALAYQKETGNSLLLGEVLRKLDLCQEEDVMKALASAYGVPFARVSPRLADPKIMDVLPREFLERHNVLPLFKVRNRLALAINEPANVFLLEEIGRLTDCEVLVVCASSQGHQGHARYAPAGRERLRHRRHHRRLRFLGSVDRRGRDGGHLRHRGGGRGLARHQAGELPDLQRRPRGCVGHPHRAGRRLAARAVPRSTAGCTRSSTRRTRCCPASPAESRSWRTWTSPSGACRRTAAST